MTLYFLRFVRSEPVYDSITRQYLYDSRRKVKRTVKADTLRQAVVKAEHALAKISTPDFQIRLFEAWYKDQGCEWERIENISNIPDWAKEQSNV